MAKRAGASRPMRVKPHLILTNESGEACLDQTRGGELEEVEAGTLLDQDQLLL